MSGRVPDVERPSAGSDVRALAEHLQVALGNRQHLSPQLGDALDSPQLIGAVDQFRWIDQMRGAFLVDENPYARVVAHQQTSGSRVIEMNVRDEHRLDVSNADPLRGERRPQRLDA